MTPEDIPSTQPIFAAIVNFFTEDNWHYAQLEKQSALRLAFKGKNDQYDCYTQAIEAQQQFIFYCLCPIKIPKSKRRAVGEFLSRANYGMIIGNFELDFAEGEVAYKTSIDVEGSTLTFPQMKRLVDTNVAMMDQYLPGIKSVIQGDASPEEAISQIENNSRLSS